MTIETIRKRRIEAHDYQRSSHEILIHITDEEIRVLDDLLSGRAVKSQFHLDQMQGIVAKHLSRPI